MAEKQESVGAIWIAETKKGDKYLNLTVEGKKYVAFKNSFKEKDTDPYYRVLVKKEMQARPQEKRNESDIPF